MHRDELLHNPIMTYGARSLSLETPSIDLSID